VKVNVCKDSGLLPSSLCSADPRGSRVIEEMFVEGTEPTETCSTHVTANVSRISNKLVENASILTQSKVFIKKDHPNPATADYPYVLPSTYDITAESQQPTTENTTSTPSVETPSTPPPVVNSNEESASANNNNSKTKHNSVGPGNNAPVNSPFSPEHAN
jgi:penicillin-binding protein 1A